MPDLLFQIVPDSAITRLDFDPATGRVAAQSGESQDLTRAPARLLLALCEEAVVRPRAPVRADDLIEHVWKPEKLRDSRDASSVRHHVRTLRHALRRLADWGNQSEIISTDRRRGFSGYYLRATVTKKVKQEHVLTPKQRDFASNPERLQSRYAGNLTSAQRELYEALLTSRFRDHSEATLDAVAASSPDSVRSYFLARYARWALADSGRIHVRFVELPLIDLTLQVESRDGLRDRTFASLSELLCANKHVQAFVVTGEPGVGKSTLLQAYELEQAQLGLVALSEGRSDFEVCVWVNLAELPNNLCAVRAKEQALRDAAGDVVAVERAQSLMTPVEWISRRWRNAYPQMPDLLELDRSHRIRLLLDGLNEISAPDAAKWRAVVTGLTESLRDAALQMASPVFSVRTRENTARMSHPGYIVHQIRLAGWTRAQMRAYCVRRLGKDARAFWRVLRQDPAVLDICRTPINLSGQCELYASGLGRAALGRGELFSGLTWVRARREFAAGRLDAPGLLAESDLQALNTDQYWLCNLLQLPDEGALIKGLDRQAIVLRKAGTLSTDVEHVADWIEPPSLRHAWIRAVRDMGLAATELGAARWTFAHHLWAEFHAARGFTRANDLMPVAELALPPMPDLHEVVRSLESDEMLPGPGITRLEEVFKLAVQLSAHPAHWIGVAAGVNLALAARAAAGCPDRIDAEVMRSLKHALLKCSRDPQTDLRVRIDAATELGLLGDDLRYICGRGPDAQYIEPKEAHWVTIPGGVYEVGTDNEVTSLPRTRVRLQPFDIAFAPVTNAEFGQFVAAGGYEDERWWQGRMARRFWRGELRNEHQILFWRPRFKALRADFNAAVERYFPNEARGYIDGELRMYASWSPERAEKELSRRFGAQKFLQPGAWNNPIYGFRHPLLPIAGICYYEAMAYCRWLSAQASAKFRLPTEAEWEVAARGGSAWQYPWGSEAPEGPFIFNADPAHLRRNSPIGVFPASDSPAGLLDLVGNVEELTSSTYRERPDRTDLVTPVLDGDELMASRGGNWSEVVEMCRATTRYSQDPAHRTFRLGFRLVRVR